MRRRVADQTVDDGIDGISAFQHVIAQTGSKHAQMRQCSDW